MRHVLTLASILATAIRSATIPCPDDVGVSGANSSSSSAEAVGSEINPGTFLLDGNVEPDALHETIFVSHLMGAWLWRKALPDALDGAQRKFHGWSSGREGDDHRKEVPALRLPLENQRGLTRCEESHAPWAGLWALENERHHEMHLMGQLFELFDTSGDGWLQFDKFFEFTLAMAAELPKRDAEKLYLGGAEEVPSDMTQDVLLHLVLKLGTIREDTSDKTDSGFCESKEVG